MIPVPIIASISMLPEHVVVWAREHRMVVPSIYRMVDNDPINLKPVEGQ
jgi:hypothetical protein